MRSIFSVDVEDWFHALETGLPIGDRARWETLPSAVEGNFPRLLDVFAERGVRVTCFFVGQTARRFPHLVRRAVAEGHEIGSHSFYHTMVFEQSRREHYEDVRATRLLLEDIGGAAVLGHRAPGFTVDGRSPWYFDTLAEAGYVYDSSLFPAPHTHGGIRTHHRAPFTLTAGGRVLHEFPITVVDIAGRPWCVFGGGYLRVTPWVVVRALGRRVLEEGRPVVFYVHPREIDAHQLRLPVGWLRRFKLYANLAGMEAKIKRVLDEFEVGPFREWLTRTGSPPPRDLGAPTHPQPRPQPTSEAGGGGPG